MAHVVGVSGGGGLKVRVAGGGGASRNAKDMATDDGAFILRMMHGCALVPVRVPGSQWPFSLKLLTFI